MSDLTKDLMFLILQFLDEECFKQTKIKLEQEWGFYFNMKYFEEKVLAGEWNELEKYLSGFTKVEDNKNSTKMFFEIRKQKYLEALDGQNKGIALDILVNDLREFKTENEDLFNELTHLLTLDNFRENEHLTRYGDTQMARSIMLTKLKELIHANPAFNGKLDFPSISSSRLRYLINQSVNWQHTLCKKQSSNPKVTTLFTDHTCNTHNGNVEPATVEVSSQARYPDIGGHRPFQPTDASHSSSALPGLMETVEGSSSVQLDVATHSLIPITSNKVSNLKRPIDHPVTRPMARYPRDDHEAFVKRLCLAPSMEEKEHLVAITTVDNGVKISEKAPCMQSLRTTKANPRFRVGPTTMPVVGSSTGNVAHESFVVNGAPGSSATNVTLESSVVNVAHGAPATNVDSKSSDVNVVHGSSAKNVVLESSTPLVSLVGPSTVGNDIDLTARMMEKSNILDSWHLTEIIHRTQCRMVTLSGSDNASSKVVQLLYTNSGVGVLALESNGILKLWKWPHNEINPGGKATTRINPSMLCPTAGCDMTNDTSGVNLEASISCLALSKNDSYIMSTIGGKITLFNIFVYRVLTTFMTPPPTPTFLAFEPTNNNVIAVGMEDSSIFIYNVPDNEVISILQGHKKCINSLAFSDNLNVLVSSSADAQICFWSIDNWVMRKSIMVALPTNKTPNADTWVKFNLDQVRLLVTQETQLAIYDSSTYERIHQWVPHDTLSARICCASYSSDSRLIFASFCDGNIGIFDANSLRLRCRIAPSAYMSSATLNSQVVYPLAIAGNPQEPNQFAIGLTDGSVKVIEPLESEESWGVTPP